MILLAATSDLSILFFFNDTATTEIYTLSLHDALPIYRAHDDVELLGVERRDHAGPRRVDEVGLHAEALAEDLGEVHVVPRSEEHTSELQSLTNLVCRLLLEKKKTTRNSMRSSSSNHRL